jgi:hypothetical protein
MDGSITLYSKITFYIDDKQLYDYETFTIGDICIPIELKRFSIIVQYKPKIVLPFDEMNITLNLYEYKDIYTVYLKKNTDEYWC